MAGHVVYTYLNEKNKYQLLGTTNSNDFEGNTAKLDIFNQENLLGLIENFNPDIVVNCIGMLINGANQFPDKTIYANSFFPHLLRRLSFEKSFKLIHISTDCVFSGKNGKYTEKSFKDATDIYGLSKSLGEINDASNLTIRTSIIGPEIKQKGEGLFHWFMNQRGPIYGYKSNIWSGVTTLELAQFIDWVIENPLTGLCHLTNNDSISKFDLLHLFNAIYSKQLIISDEKDYASNKSFVNTNSAIGYSVASYKKMLEDQKEFMDAHQNFYTHYKNQ